MASSSRPNDLSFVSPHMSEEAYQAYLKKLEEEHEAEKKRRAETDATDAEEEKRIIDESIALEDRRKKFVEDKFQRELDMALALSKEDQTKALTELEAVAQFEALTKELTVLLERADKCHHALETIYNELKQIPGLEASTKLSASLDLEIFNEISTLAKTDLTLVLNQAIRKLIESLETSLEQRSTLLNKKTDATHKKKINDLFSEGIDYLNELAEIDPPASTALLTQLEDMHKNPKTLPVKMALFVTEIKSKLIEQREVVALLRNAANALHQQVEAYKKRILSATSTQQTNFNIALQHFVACEMSFNKHPTEAKITEMGVLLDKLADQLVAIEVHQLSESRTKIYGKGLQVTNQLAKYDRRAADTLRKELEASKTDCDKSPMALIDAALKQIQTFESEEKELLANAMAQTKAREDYIAKMQNEKKERESLFGRGNELLSQLMAFDADNAEKKRVQLDYHFKNSSDETTQQMRDLVAELSTIIASHQKSASNAAVERAAAEGKALTERRQEMVETRKTEFRLKITACKKLLDELHQLDQTAVEKYLPQIEKYETFAEALTRAGYYDSTSELAALAALTGLHHNLSQIISVKKQALPSLISNGIKQCNELLDKLTGLDSTAATKQKAVLARLQKQDVTALNALTTLANDLTALIAMKELEADTERKTQAVVAAQAEEKVEKQEHSLTEWLTEVKQSVATCNVAITMECLDTLTDASPALQKEMKDVRQSLRALGQYCLDLKTSQPGANPATQQRILGQLKFHCANEQTNALTTLYRFVDELAAEATVLQRQALHTPTKPSGRIGDYKKPAIDTNQRIFNFFANKQQEEKADQKRYIVKVGYGFKG